LFEGVTFAAVVVVMDGTFQMDDALLEEASRCFRDTKTNVLAAFSVQKTRQFGAFNFQSSAVKQAKDRILCLVAKPQKNNPNEQKCKLVLIKRQQNEGLQIKDSWKLKTISSIAASGHNRSDAYQATLSFGGFGSETFHFASEGERNAFAGCVLYSNQQTHQKTIECIDFEAATCVSLWKEAASSSEPKGTARQESRDEVAKGKDDGGSAFASSGVETDFESFIADSGFSLNHLKGFDKYLQSQLSDLDTTNIHSILTSVDDVDSVISRIDETLEYVEDLEEWLNVFNIKLQHMRLDISTIEERNNALETRSNNNSSLLKELKSLEQSMQLDADMSEILVAGNFCFGQGLKASVDAAKKLYDVLSGLETITSFLEGEDQKERIPEILKGMRVVKERKAELKRHRSHWLARAQSFLSSLFDSTVDKAVSDISGIDPVHDAFHLKSSVRSAISQLHSTSKGYSELIDAMILLDPAMAESLAQHYAKASNRLVKLCSSATFAKPSSSLSSLSSEAHQKRRSSAENIATSIRHALKLKQPSKSPSDSETNADDDIPQLFADILEIVLPMLCQDCVFCRTTFFHSKCTTGDSNTAQGQTNIFSSSSRPLRLSIEAILDGVEDHLFNFIKNAMKIDGALAVPFMKLASFWMHTTSKRDEYFKIHQWLQGCQSIAKSTLTKFMEDHIRHIESTHSIRVLKGKSVKHMSILPCIFNLPNVVEHVETLSQKVDDVVELKLSNASVDDDCSLLLTDLIDGAYSRYSEKVFALLEKIASGEVKTCHAERLRIENYDFYCSAMGSYQKSESTLSAYFDIAVKRMNESKSRYLEDAIQWSAFADLFQFSEGLESVRREVPESDVCFQYGFTIEDFTKAMTKLPTDIDLIKNQIVAMSNRVQKHFKNDQILFKQMLRMVIKEMSANFKSLERNTKSCYPNFVTQLPWPQIIAAFDEIAARA